jgi:CheY-like chemotaxis protein
MTSVDQAPRALEEAALCDAPFTVVILDGAIPLATVEHLLTTARQHAGNAIRGIVCLGAHHRSAWMPFKSIGCAGYLLRPVRPSTLLAQCLGHSWTPRNATASEDHATLPQRTDARARLRVLLAEDNAINALVARRMLERAECDVTHVLNGREAVDAVARGDAQAFDLVLMDVHMPLMDGIEATRTIRSHFAAAGDIARARSRPKIVALTANAFAEDRQRCLDAGMDDYLAKPFERADFDALLNRLRAAKLAES